MLPNPWTVLTQATKAVPALRFVLAVAALAAVLALVQSWKIDVRVAGWGALIVVVLATLLIVFARASTLPKGSTKQPAVVLMWFCTVLFMAVSSLLVSCIFFRSPVDLEDWLRPSRKDSGSQTPPSSEQPVDAPNSPPTGGTTPPVIEEPPPIPPQPSLDHLPLTKEASQDWGSRGIRGSVTLRADGTIHSAFHVWSNLVFDACHAGATAVLRDANSNEVTRMNLGEETAPAKGFSGETGRDFGDEARASGLARDQLSRVRIIEIEFRGP